KSEQSGAGGVASILTNLPKENHIWVHIKEEKIVTNTQDDFIPINKLWPAFYLGMCNSFFWPLLHDTDILPLFKNEWWKAYQQVNRLYCELIEKHAVSTDDIFFINDYQLLLLPQYLRKVFPNNKIVYFHHIPWGE